MGLVYSIVIFIIYWKTLALPRMGDYGVRSPGHEGAGVVLAVGHDVKGWKLGDRVGIAPTWDTCMSCELCSSDMECHCPEAVPTGLKFLVRLRFFTGLRLSMAFFIFNLL
jgi:propanol-preferring alcohol dehydrogenase